MTPAYLYANATLAISAIKGSQTVTDVSNGVFSVSGTKNMEFSSIIPLYRMRRLRRRVQFSAILVHNILHL